MTVKLSSSILKQQIKSLDEAVAEGSEDLFDDFEVKIL